jgi:hypothetical protein
MDAVVYGFPLLLLDPLIDIAGTPAILLAFTGSNRRPCRK